MIFLINQNPHNCFVFQTTESFLVESPHQNGIIRWGQNSDIAMRLGHRAPFTAFTGEHAVAVARSKSVPT